jgi:hypothetical protein
MSKHHLFNSVEEVYTFLSKHGAPSRLVRHAQFVAEVAKLLSDKLRNLSITLDEHFIVIGAAIHDAGKIKHSEELAHAGNLHENTGEEFLLELGIDPKLARVCRSHSQWKSLECSLEELIIALADNLWKGKRNEELEQVFLEKLAQSSSQDKWELFLELDTCFETIANQGDSRLLNS